MTDTNYPTLAELAKQGELTVLEERWLSTIEAPEPPADDLLETLDILCQNRKTDLASTLAWTWLAGAGEKQEPGDILAIGKEMLLRCGDNDDLRQQIAELYKQVYADRTEISKLIDISGLSGAKTPRRALRTMDICLGLNEGDHLVSRSEERAATVVSINPKICMYTIRTSRGDEILEPDELSLAYDLADDNDIRVLMQLNPDKLSQIFESNPVSLIIGILKSQHGQIDSDELEHMLSPKYISADAWKKWWNKAKNALKRCPNVFVEGRNPVILTYHEEGKSLEDEIAPQWAQAHTPAQRIAVIDTYFREAKLRKIKVEPAMIERMRNDLLDRVNTTRQGSPSDALTEALIIDRLVQGTRLPQDSATLAREILAENDDYVTLLRGIKEIPLYLQALKYIGQIRPDDWLEVYAQLLPFASINGCELIGESLIKNQRLDLLADAVQNIPIDFTNHLDAVCWLWRKPLEQVPQPMPGSELLAKLLNHLGDITRSDNVPAEIVRDTRHKIRSALSADKYTRYHELIKQMDSGLASTVYRQVDRLDGLGQVVRSKLLAIIRDTYPQMFVKEKADPWRDEETLYGTREGMNRREEELNHIMNVKIPQNAKAIGEAAARGDLSENSEYKFALEERDFLHAQVATIQNELSRARLLTVDDISTDKVNIGTRLTLQNIQTSDRKEITILGPWESDIEKHIYNYAAPLCLKLKDLKPGDVVQLSLEGPETEYRIENITNALEG
ncbi:MAG: GreA/GreB family elongation factor [Planctomycetota bacterium]|jgi:transcription elongation GreA/GreB family factor